MESESESALEFFLNHISGPVVQAKCVNCHVEGGVSGHTRLILHPASNPDHGALNLAVFENFLANVEDGANLILNKIQGVGHGGGIQVPAGSDDFANMESFLRLLGHEDSGPVLSPETLFDTVTMASPGKTLRRAALIFGGRIPTREEREAVDNGTEEDLRVAIRNLMTGPGFHQFLIRASNDRLLTDRHLGWAIDVTNSYFVDLANLHWTKAAAALDKGHSRPSEDPKFSRWFKSVQYGFARAPLELIAHVVENDLPYTEIMVADYIMANPMAAQAYGAETQFHDVDDPHEFRPSEIVSYYRNDDSKDVERAQVLGVRVLDPGNLSTDYPHAGILNTTVFLLRYPTTPTNRNRARSRWTYYQFLGLDIEKSASRTTDADALADTDNPTMQNSACTVCHRVMDPVGGTFQNYGELGEYRDEWGGKDSLDGLYKHPEDGSYTPYQSGDTWYRDMREPGFNGRVAPDADNSLQWLSEQIVADDRFSEATVKFWWPAIMGVEIATPPEDKNDSDFEAMLLTSNAQIAEVQRLSEAFRTGIAGGAPYNLKDLLVEIALSPWFRAESIADDDPVRAAALRNAGVERLLTPEELSWKTEAITGYGWERNLRNWSRDTVSGLTSDGGYHLFYGGIDSDGITERAREITPLMAAVAQSHAVESSCPIVQREFLFWSDENRRLFGGIDKNVSPVSEVSGTAVIEAESWEERETNSWTVFLAAGFKNVRLGFLNDYYNPETHDNRDLILDEVTVRDGAGAVVERVKLENDSGSKGVQSTPLERVPGKTRRIWPLLWNTGGRMARCCRFDSRRWRLPNPVRSRILLFVLSVRLPGQGFDLLAQLLLLLLQPSVAHRLVLRAVRLELGAVQAHVSQTHQPQGHRQLHRLLEAGPEELPVVLPEIAQHPEVRAVPPGDEHEAEIFPAALLDLPGTEHAVTVGVDQDRDDLARRVGTLTPVAYRASTSDVSSCANSS